MSRLKKLLSCLTSQIKKSSVKLPAADKPHKIKDDNQSIHNGVIYEKLDSSLRGESKPTAKRKRTSKRTP